MNFRQQVEHFFQKTLDVLYPIREGDLVTPCGDLACLQPVLRAILEQEVVDFSGEPEQTAAELTAQLPEIKAMLNKDLEAIFQGDPAAASYQEVVIAYPGFYAIAAYRIAHHLLKAGVPLVPRIITEHAHSYTGIDIHPGAVIGSHLCIDHGTGVVIGETTVIGNHVKIYQGVTLGALSILDRHVQGQRHPTIEDEVVIYAQATILGGDTVIGRKSIIGGNVWITRSVPPGSKVYYKLSESMPVSIEKGKRAVTQNKRK